MAYLVPGALGRFVGFWNAVVGAVYSYTGSEMGQPKSLVAGAGADVKTSRGGRGRDEEPKQERLSGCASVFLPNRLSLLRLDLLCRYVPRLSAATVSDVSEISLP